MGKRGSYQGESPTDRAAGLMDKFIRRSEKKRASAIEKYGKQYRKGTPIHTWPLGEQIDYWDSLTEDDWFRRKYPTYSDWRVAVQDKSGMYPITFRDVTSNHKQRMMELYESCVSVASSIEILQKEGIIH